eukprot:m.88246 g.88246  ORF g.88246 m.88246 type:complete len:337 (+) comp8358_c1_seq3:182-1192(+)
MANLNEYGVRNFLSSQNVPDFLHNAFIEALRRVQHRFFIVDDSGSMQREDGHVLVKTPREDVLVQTSSRWRELTESMRFHAGLAQAAGARFEFRLLNMIPPVYLGLNDGQDPAKAGALLRAFDSSPTGGTPLCRHIREIIAEIVSIKDQLLATGQKAVLVIATDGEASDGNLAEAMRPLEQLPVYVIVRLCTDSDEVVRYWNSIDESLELQLDVLDDLFSEAKEVHKKNPWFTYNEHVHQLRVLGLPIPELDQLDECLLAPDQLRVAVGVLLGLETAMLPHPRDNWHAFVAAIEERLRRCTPVWCPVARARRPMINIATLEHKYSRLSGKSECTLS